MNINIFNNTYFLLKKGSKEHIPITVKEIRKEKGKEEIYYFSLGDSNCVWSLPFGKFDEIYGADSNFVETDVYTLTFAVPHKALVRYHYDFAKCIQISRYSILGQEPFTKEEIMELAEKAAIFIHYGKGQSGYGKELVEKLGLQENFIYSKIIYGTATFNSGRKGFLATGLQPVRTCTDGKVPSPIQQKHCELSSGTMTHKNPLKTARVKRQEG